MCSPLVMFRATHNITHVPTVLVTVLVLVTPLCVLICSFNPTQVDKSFLVYAYDEILRVESGWDLAAYDTKWWHLIKSLLQVEEVM
jgi:hypothetical protein